MLLFWNALIVDGEGGEVGRWESGEIVRGGRVERWENGRFLFYLFIYLFIF